MVREVAESIRDSRAERPAKHHYCHNELQRVILATLDDGGMSLWDLSGSTGKSERKVAWALGHLISKGYIVTVRQGKSVTFEKIPGSLFNFILEHEV